MKLQFTAVLPLICSTCVSNSFLLKFSCTKSKTNMFPLGSFWRQNRASKRHCSNIFQRNQLAFATSANYINITITRQKARLTGLAAN